MTLNKDAWFSSASGEWGTDSATFERYRRRWSLNIDLAASVKNRKLECYISRERNLLRTDPREVLGEHRGEQPCGGARGWLNPIYGDAEQPCRAPCRKKRCEKRGYHESEYQPGIIDFMRRGRHLVEVALALEVCCCLVPARTDTAWWWETVNRPSGALLGMAEPGPGIVRRMYAGMTIEVEQLKGRESFLNEAGEKEWSAPFPSAVVTFSAPHVG